jgi:RimJ/RimL family protein N-acetyltransferase
MPSFKEHIKFVNSKPYSKWYIIKQNNENVGSIYLSKQNEIGLFLKNNVQGQNIGTEALKLLIMKNPKKRILANINPKNKKSIKFFEKNGFKLIQYTFELEK